jgi:hypothetical protein
MPRAARGARLPSESIHRRDSRVDHFDDGRQPTNLYIVA